MKNIDEKIKKIVALIDGAATEGEARAASLALQRLLVANNLKLEDINLDDSPAKVGEEVCDLGRRIPEWKKTLALVVAANYRCRAYTSYSNNGRTVVFVGEGEDSVVASCCFRASANAAENCFRTYCARMKAMGYGNVSRQKGVKGTWMLGFISGLKRAYAEQVSNDESMALAIVVPESVNRHMDGIGLRTTKIKVRTTSDPFVKADGYESGYGFGRGDRVTAASHKKKRRGRQKTAPAFFYLTRSNGQWGSGIEWETIYRRAPLPVRSLDELPNYGKGECMNNGKSELQNYVITTGRNSAKAANRKIRTTKLRISRTIEHRTVRS